MPEFQQPLVQRVADLESTVHALRRELSQRQREPLSVSTQGVEWVRTAGKVTGEVSDYPLQTIGTGQYELPAVFLDGKLSEPFAWTPRSATPQTNVISPGGWIPETIEPLPVFWHQRSRRYYFCNPLPTLRVVANENIAADDYGEVSLWLGGADTGIDFVGVYNDWLNGGASLLSGDEARATLDWDLGRWSIYVVEC